MPPENIFYHTYFLEISRKYLEISRKQIDVLNPLGRECWWILPPGGGRGSDRGSKSRFENFVGRF